ncbi:MAG: hypothetical protein DHS20C16_14800 [Phycisphaerae bacterium]|nr:MAG: hypothetical protein DHS20C16_14800 [Phycisphaerae bacterium]
MSNWLEIWGASETTLLVFLPILQDLAKDVAKSGSENFVKKCFKKVFSPLSRDPLTKATGRAATKLLQLIEDELLDCGLDRTELEDWLDDVRSFINHDDVCNVIGPLFIESETQLDPAVFDGVWQGVARHSLPNGFQWRRITKRFAREVGRIRESSSDLRDAFARSASTQASTGISELVGVVPDFDLVAYREAIKGRFEHVNLESLDTSGPSYDNTRLWKIFIPQTVRECIEISPRNLELPKEEQRGLAAPGSQKTEQGTKGNNSHQEFSRQPPLPVLDVLDDPKMNRVVVLGDPGSGKSSLLRYLAVRWARIENTSDRESSPLPLLIDLRKYNSWSCLNGKSFPRFMNDANGYFRLNERQLVNQFLKKPDRAVLLLDGLDEIFDTKQREDIVDDIVRFTSTYPDTRIIVTSRIVEFQSHSMNGVGFRQYVLQDLDRNQIDQFIDKWHREVYRDELDGKVKRDRLRNAIYDSTPIAMLAGNPLLLTLMAILNRNQELPRSRAELYAQASRVLLHQWDAGRALHDYPQLRGEVDLRAKQEILRRIAFAMQSGPIGLRGNMIEGSTLSDLIEEYLQSNLGFGQSRAAANALVKQLRVRNFIICSVGDDRYAFVHRTFLEFYCADHYVNLYKEKRKLDADEISKVIEDHCREEAWQEVLLLICSQVDDELVNSVLLNLTKRADPPEKRTSTAVPELLLAVQIIGAADRGTIQELTGAEVFRVVVNTLVSRRILGISQANLPVIRFMYQMHDAVLQAGARWPGVPEPEAIEFPEWSPDLDLAYNVLCSLVAALSSSRNAMLDMLKSNTEAKRLSAIAAISRRWPDEQTRKLLVNLATSDSEPYVRLISLVTLLNQWCDDVTRGLLIGAVESDFTIVPEFEKPSYLLELLVHFFPDDETRELIARIAKGHEDHKMREGAITLIPSCHPTDASRLQLRELAVELSEESMRVHALNTLIHSCPNNDTLEFLRTRSQNEKSELQRDIADGAERLQIYLEEGGPLTGIWKTTIEVLKLSE